MRTNITSENMSMADLDELILFLDNYLSPKHRQQTIKSDSLSITVEGRRIVYYGRHLIHPEIFKMFKQNPDSRHLPENTVRIHNYEFVFMNDFPTLTFYVEELVTGPTHINQLGAIVNAWREFRAIARLVSVFEIQTKIMNDAVTLVKISEDPISEKTRQTPLS